MASKTKYLLEQQAKFTRHSLHGEGHIEPAVAKLFNACPNKTHEEQRSSNSMPSLDEIFTQLEREEVVDADDEVIESGGLPIISRSSLEEKQKTFAADDDDDDDWPFGAPPLPEEKKHVEDDGEIDIPCLDEILGKLDEELLDDEPEVSTTAETRDDSSDVCLELGTHFDADRKLGDAMQTCTEQQQWSIASRAPRRAFQAKLQELVDMREHFDSKFHEAKESTSFLRNEAGFKTTRPSVPSAQTIELPKEESVEEPICEAQYATHYEYMQDVLQGFKKKEMSTKQNVALEAKPPDKRVESLPGMRMLGAPKKAACKPGQTPTSLKKGGEMERKLRHANAGGSLETMLAIEDDDPDSRIPDCDMLFGGAPLRFTSVPQFYTCVSQCQQDDWRYIPKSISQDWRETRR